MTTSGAEGKGEYALEDIRTFVARRPWLHGELSAYELVTDDEYAALLARKPVAFGQKRIDHIRSFMIGWFAAKG